MKDTFSYDLHVGHTFETSVVDHYSPHYTVTTTQGMGRCKSHDLTLDPDGDPVKIEVKYDRMAHKTGNHAVELYTKYKGSETIHPSGLSATESDVYVFGFEGLPGVYGMDTGKLKRLVEEKKYFRIVDHTGDGNATIALFKLDWFLQQCEFLYNK